MTSIRIHRCESIAVERHDPENGNSIALVITNNTFGRDKNGDLKSVSQETELVFFGLPTEVTDVLLEHFGNPNEAEQAA